MRVEPSEDNRSIELAPMRRPVVPQDIGLDDLQLRGLLVQEIAVRQRDIELPAETLVIIETY